MKGPHMIKSKKSTKPLHPSIYTVNSALTWCLWQNLNFPPGGKIAEFIGSSTTWLILSIVTGTRILSFLKLKVFKNLHVLLQTRRPITLGMQSRSFKMEIKALFEISKLIPMKAKRTEDFFSVSNIHICTGNMGSGDLHMYTRVHQIFKNERGIWHMPRAY